MRYLLIIPALALAALVVAVTGGQAFAGDAESPRDRVKVTIDEIVKIVESSPGEENKGKRREQLRELINPLFDFGEMSKRSLGTHWKDATEEEKREFVAVFSDLLAKTYLGKIETVKAGMVTVDSESVEVPRANVKTTVHNKGETFPLEYKMHNMSGKWRVYDVVIENIGLVANYRNEFAGIIRKDKLSGLIERLKNKKSEG